MKIRLSCEFIRKIKPIHNAHILGLSKEYDDVIERNNVSLKCNSAHYGLVLWFLLSAVKLTQCSQPGQLPRHEESKFSPTEQIKVPRRKCG